METFAVIFETPGNKTMDGQIAREDGQLAIFVSKEGAEDWVKNKAHLLYVPGSLRVVPFNVPKP